jgi:hypothetical protein
VAKPPAPAPAKPPQAAQVKTPAPTPAKPPPPAQDKTPAPAKAPPPAQEKRPPPQAKTPEPPGPHIPQDEHLSEEQTQTAEGEQQIPEELPGSDLQELPTETEAPRKKPKAKKSRRRGGKSKKFLVPLTLVYLIILLFKLVTMMALTPDAVLVFWPLEWTTGILLAWFGLRQRLRGLAVAGLSGPVVAVLGMLLVEQLGLTKPDSVTLLQWLLIGHAVFVLLIVARSSLFRKQAKRTPAAPTKE